jgi:sec-independent protein translocase protein TatB
MFPLENGAFEMLVLGALALIIVGPKDLPMLMRKVGQFTAKMRGLAAEFRASFEEMARQSELDELRKEVEALRTGQYVAPVSGEIDKAFYDYDQTPATPPPLSPLPLPTNGEDMSPPSPHPKDGDGVKAPKSPAPKSPAPKFPAPKSRKSRAKAIPPAEPGA